MTRRQEAGSRQEAGGRRQEAGGRRRQEAGGRRQEAGGRRQDQEVGQGSQRSPQKAMQGPTGRASFGVFFDVWSGFGQVAPSDWPSLESASLGPKKPRRSVGFGSFFNGREAASLQSSFIGRLTLPHRSDGTFGRGPRSEPRAPMRSRQF